MSYWLQQQGKGLLAQAPPFLSILKGILAAGAILGVLAQSPTFLSILKGNPCCW